MPIVLLHMRVEDAEILDDLGLRVRKQRIGDALAFREISQNANGIVADRGNSQALLTKPFGILLQLHELRFAVRSPIRGPEEDHHGSLRSANRIEIL